MRISAAVLMIALYSGANFYIFLRLWQMLPATAARIALVVFAVVVLAAPFVVFGLGERLPHALSAGLYRLGTDWMIAFLYLLIAFLVLDILRLCGVPLNPYMRESWPGFAVLMGALALLLTSGYLHYRHKHEERITVDTGKNAPLKVAFISDLHLGMTIGKSELEGWIDLLAAQSPDVVLIGGDLIDNMVGAVEKMDLGRPFDRINAKYGVYAVLGNHEYISGAERSADLIKNLGITLLQDSVVEAAGCCIIGRDDRSNHHRKPLSELVAGLDPGKPVIVVDHQPSDLSEAEQCGADIQFSGHTHYGQVWPMSWVTKLIYENPCGLSQRGKTHIYVSPGIGIWGGKFRIGTRSEYVIAEIK